MVDLTPTLREALEAALASGRLDAQYLPVLQELRDACPGRPALADGIYEVPDEDGDYHILYVRDGRFSSLRSPDGSLHGGGSRLPDDSSTWRRIDGPPTVTPEQIEEGARVVSGHSESSWSTLSQGTRDHYRTRARAILAAAGIEVSE